MKKSIILIPVMAVILSACTMSVPLKREINRLPTNLTSLSDMEFFMEQGAKISEDEGIMYRAFLNKNDYDEMLEQGYYDISFGLIFTTVENKETKGELNVENIFSSQAVYTLNKEETSKTYLEQRDVKKEVDYHRICLTANILDIKDEDLDKEFSATMYIKAFRFGMVNYAVARQDENDLSFVYLAQTSRNNVIISKKQQEIIDNVIARYKALKGENFNVNYKVEIYKDDVLDETLNLSAPFDSKVKYEPTPVTGMSFQVSRSKVEEMALANNKTVLKAYYLDDPEYSIVYYTTDAKDNYIESFRYDNLSAKRYALISLTDEQLPLPEGSVLADESLASEYALNRTDSVLMGVNDGTLILKVCYGIPVTERDTQYMSRNDETFTLTAARGTGQSFGYKFFRKYSKTAVLSARIPKEMVGLGGSVPVAGITFTNGNTLAEGNAYRPALHADHAPGREHGHGPDEGQEIPRGQRRLPF